MENKKDFLIIMLGLAALCFAFTIKKAENKISIAEAVTKGIIKIQISGKGGHEGNCIRLDVTNLKSSSITITFDAGRRLNSRDESEQDLLIVRDQLVGLRPGEKKKY